LLKIFNPITTIFGVGIVVLQNLREQENFVRLKEEFWFILDGLMVDQHPL